MDLQLAGKVAFITGASKGIGRAVAEMLAREGADVVITARTGEPLAAAAKQIAAETGRAIVPMTGSLNAIRRPMGQYATNAVPRRRQAASTESWLR